MWKQRAVTLCRCLAIFSPVVGCAYAGGEPPQAYMPGPGYPPAEAYLPPQAYAPPQTYAPVAPATVQPAENGTARVYAVGPSAPAAIVVVLPGPGELGTGSPQLWADQGFDVVTSTPAEFYRFAADQQAAAARLIAQARALADAPIWLVGPNPAIAAAMASMPASGPGQVTGVVVTSTSTGAGTCSEQMSYSYSGNEAAPKVSVSKSGNACPSGSLFGPRSIGPGTNSIEAPPRAHGSAPCSAIDRDLGAPGPIAGAARDRGGCSGAVEFAGPAAGGAANRRNDQNGAVKLIGDG